MIPPPSVQNEGTVSLQHGNSRGKDHGNVRLRLLGSLTLWRDGAPVALPASRKTRALLTYLALAPVATNRTRLCDLLWDAPNDPRAELRWCLSKLRALLDDDDCKRVAATGETIALDFGPTSIDANEVLHAIQSDLSTVPLDTLRETEALFDGPFADGLELDGSPEFTNWLAAQRRRFRDVHVRLLEALIARCPTGSLDAFMYIDKWLQLTPFDCRPHDALLDALLASGRIQEAELHLAATIKSFDAEGVSWLPIRERWRAKRSAHAPAIEAFESPSSGPRATLSEARGARRASICVMPFALRDANGTERRSVADGLTDDIITRLAKLRALFVIARGSAYALAERRIAAEEAGHLLNVDYVASGSLHIDRERLVVVVELCDVRSGGILWAEDFRCKPDDLLQAIEDIGDRIVACIAEEIEGAERNRALLKSPESLDSWEAYHRGLWHMYRFNGADNARAMHFFQRAIRQDPTFSRAYAGLSFTHFQNAFLHRPAERSLEIDLAYEAAGQSLLADDRDPAAHWAMGRALWLRERHDDALGELQQCVRLSPNFALGHYTLGFVQCQSGDPHAAIAATDMSRHLSPFDPLTFAMHASRALAHARLREFREAADWAMKGAMRPNAHAHVLAIAANCLGMVSRDDEARRCVEAIRRQAPNYTFDDFARAFHLPAETIALLRNHAPLIGL
jgi:DNA-binding SARP family transcriptional activator/TolB-like protein